MTEPASGWDCHVHVFDAAAPVRAGHYQPAHRPLAQIEAQAGRVGVGHLVLVQPSVYGTDHSVMLRALREQPGRHRGVAVPGEGTTEAELDDWDAAGMRGARFNQVSPLGETGYIVSRFRTIAPMLRERGWHLQWYAEPRHLPQIAALHTADSVTCVLDHLGGLAAGIRDDDPAWTALRALADRGAWMKMSGWYRLGAVEPYTALLPLIVRVADLFGEHLVWGSDWPHTSFAPDALPAYESTWAPLVGALGVQRATRVRDRATALYARGLPTTPA
ncbi:MAG: amidohydrolase family protein [Burkholderiales bacterium]|nr:amidohydrolase family protein [Burkholderiales bacterium]